MEDSIVFLPLFRIRKVATKLEAEAGCQKLESGGKKNHDNGAARRAARSRAARQLPRGHDGGSAQVGPPWSGGWLVEARETLKQSHRDEAVGDSA